MKEQVFSNLHQRSKEDLISIIYSLNNDLRHANEKYHDAIKFFKMYDNATKFYFKEIEHYREELREAKTEQS